jgi:hypothetical protein
MEEYILKKIDNRFILWFKQSNQWISLEEPAWLVIRLYQKGIDLLTISGKLSKTYKLPLQECQTFVNDICEGLLKFSHPVSSPVPDANSLVDSRSYFFHPYSVKQYLIGDKRIAINFETRRSEFYIHPSLAYLECRMSGDANIQFDIFENDSVPVLRETNTTVAVFPFEDYMQLKNQLYIQVANFLYHKTANDWLSFVHASSITDGKQTLLLSSASGSGKSTMAALLQTKGLRLVSDDFVPIDVKTKKAFPFPAGLSVKDGAFDLLSPHYSDLRDPNLIHYKYQHHSVRYIPLPINDIDYFRPRPVKTIVFIGYNPSVSCNFTSLPINESLRLFHEQAWISRTPEHARIFINWFVKLRCVHLEYGNTEEAITALMSLFESPKLYD